MNPEFRLAAGAVAIAAGLLPAVSTAMPARAAVAAGGFAACYDATAPTGINIPVTLTGGGPTDHWVLAASYPGEPSGSAGHADGKFDANGDATTTLSDVFVPGDPIDPTAGRPVDLSIADYVPDATAPVTTALGSVLLSERGLDVNFGNGKPLDRHLVTVASTTFAGKQLYGFVTNDAGTKVLRRFHLGEGDPSCGYAKGAEIIAPARIAEGDYRVYVNAGTTLNRSAALSERFTLAP